MEKTYEQVLQGYKKSLEALKKIDSETYAKFQKLFKTFDKDEVDEFFKTMQIDMNSTKKVPNSKSSISINITNNEEECTKITMYYGISYDVKIEKSIKNENTYYTKYTLCPLVENVQNYMENCGTILFKKTTVNNGVHSKLYYGIRKKGEGLEIFTQDMKHNIMSTVSLKEMPSGKEIE